MKKNVLVVVDMQVGVLAMPRHDREGKAALINQLIDAADQVVFIQHAEGDMYAGGELWQIIPELHQPAHAHCVTKTACDAFWNTTLDDVLQRIGTRAFTVCGCATDYCVDTTIKVGASKGYAITVAADAHTTADRTYASAQQLIGQHNEVWAGYDPPSALAFPHPLP
ncbi:MAG: isochorismatase family protein [Symbiopectobacterium sp.]|uniref:isochorismatase family protein n=1 Tax=Symbiopectobacterium sp. TaxID=2952789 RepID=UPI0039EC0364